MLKFEINKLQKYQVYLYMYNTIKSEQLKIKKKKLTILNNVHIDIFFKNSALYYLDKLIVY